MQVSHDARRRDQTLTLPAAVETLLSTGPNSAFHPGQGALVLGEDLLRQEGNNLSHRSRDAPSCSLQLYVPTIYVVSLSIMEHVLYVLLKIPPHCGLVVHLPCYLCTE